MASRQQLCLCISPSFKPPHSDKKTCYKPEDSGLLCELVFPREMSLYAESERLFTKCCCPLKSPDYLPRSQWVTFPAERLWETLSALLFCSRVAAFSFTFTDNIQEVFSSWFGYLCNKEGCFFKLKCGAQVYQVSKTFNYGISNYFFTIPVLKWSQNTSMLVFGSNWSANKDIFRFVSLRIKRFLYIVGEWLLRQFCIILGSRVILCTCIL